RDLRMHQRLTTGDGDHRRAALFHGGKTLFRREVFLEDVRGILDLAASGAGQVAAEERLQHEDERVALASRKLLLEHIARDGPHLGYGNCHYRPSLFFSKPGAKTSG